MDKAFATYRLGGTEDLAARWLGLPVEVYRDWPERLAPVMVDRIYAAIMRRETGKVLGMTTPKAYFADGIAETVLEATLERVSCAAVMANLMPNVPSEYARKKDGPRRRKPRSKPPTTSSKPIAASPAV